MIELYGKRVLAALLFEDPLAGDLRRHDRVDDGRGRDCAGRVEAYGLDRPYLHAESILIVGPGEAKGELRERLARQGLQARIVGVEAADKMTDRQIAALVRERFAEEPA